MGYVPAAERYRLEVGKELRTDEGRFTRCFRGIESVCQFLETEYSASSSKIGRGLHCIPAPIGPSSFPMTVTVATRLPSAMNQRQPITVA